jgi:hypothetical protein
VRLMASHVPGVSFRRVAFRLAKGPSSTFARALCDDGERVCDKIAASKRKGLWVGGPVPLGYRTEAVCGEAGLKSDTNKLTPFILVRIQVPQPTFM